MAVAGLTEVILEIQNDYTGSVDTNLHKGR